MNTKEVESFFDKKLRIDIVEDKIKNLEKEVLHLKAENERLKVMILDLMEKQEKIFKEAIITIPTPITQNKAQLYDEIQDIPKDKPEINPDNKPKIYM